MRTAALILEYCLAAGFLTVGFVCWVRGNRTEDTALGHAARAFLLLGATLTIAVVDTLTDHSYAMIPAATVAAFLASAWQFMMFRHRMIPLATRTRAVAAVILLVTYAAFVITDRSSSENFDSGIASAVTTLLGLVWSGFLAEPLYRFWRASRNRPRVQRARLRVLSVGFALSIVIAISWTAGEIVSHPPALVTVEAVALLLIPLMLVSFTPPRWLRRVWRDREEVSLRAAQDLALFHADEADLGHGAVEWALRLVGGEAGFIVTANGTVLGRVGVTDDDVAGFLERGIPGEPSIASLHADRTGFELVVPLLHEGPAALVVWTGPFTPVFDREELERLRAFASVVSVALDRFRLVSALNQENTRYEHLLRAVSDLGHGVVVTDAGRLVYANDAYCELTGYTREELIALPSLIELSPPEERAIHSERLKKRLAGGAVEDHYEAALITKDGRTVYTEAAVKLMATEDGLRIVAVVHDVTSRKEHELKLRELDDLKTEFIGNAAHELRTPLTAIVGLAATLAERRTRLSEEDVAACINGLDRGARRLATLVNRLLDFTQIERGGLSVAMERVGLSAAARDALVANPPPDGVTMRVEVADDVVVWADPTRLDQILTNLISNAYRYGGQEILIHAAHSDSEVVVEVADDGPGVPENIVQHLFDPFVRGSNDQDGSGLGLAIVHRLAEAFGGTVTYQPGEPRGARFRVHLREAV